MSKVTDLLSQGDMRTTGRSEEVVKQALAKPGLFSDVVNAMLDDDPGVRMRAADAAEKISRLHPDWLKPYKKLFLNTIANIKQQEVRWHVAQILPRFELTAPEQRTVVALMNSFLSDDSRIVKTFAMQALADMAIHDHQYLPEVTKIIEKLMKDGSPAMKARGKKLLVKLKKEDLG